MKKLKACKIKEIPPGEDNKQYTFHPRSDSRNWVTFYLVTPEIVVDHLLSARSGRGPSDH